jgi:stage V sporulation protein G
MFALPDAGNLKGFADLIINDELVIKGLRIIEGKKGLFVSMPKEQGKDAKWYDQVVCMKADTFERISEVLLNYYKEMKCQSKP